MTACEPLCAPITGGAESLPLPADRDRIWAAVPPLWREDSPHSGFFTGDERKSRRKPWRFYGAWAVTSARSAGGFWGRGLTLFRGAKIAIDAVFGKTGEYPRC